MTVLSLWFGVGPDGAAHAPGIGLACTVALNPPHETTSPPMMDEAQLQSALRRAQRGSEIAFGQIYGQFSRRVFGLCLKMLGARDQAEDATSEVFEKLRGAFEHYDPTRPFDRWLLTIASRHCLNVLRRGRLERRLFTEETPESSASETTSSPHFACESDEQRRSLMAVIDELPESYRLPLVMRYYGDLSYDEIAAEIGTTRAHVAVLLHRGKNALRARLGSHDEERP